MSLETAAADGIHRIAPVYLVWHGEFTLDAPPEEVWRHVINYTSWQNYSTVRHVSGERGQEGEVVLLQKDDLRPYYARTVKLDPGSRIVWKTFPQERTEENDFFGFVDFKVRDVQGRGCFCYDNLYEFRVRHREQTELDQFRQQLHEKAEVMFATILPKLQSVVANAHAAAVRAAGV